MSRYDIIIVGSGFFGATFARKATDAGKKCLVIEKSPHVAGAAYDKRWDNGILVAEYGAHIFHCDSEEIWKFVNQFTTMETFVNRPKILSGNNIYSFPINLMTLHQLWGVITPEEARNKLNEVRIPCKNPRNFEEWILDKVGPEIYNLFIYGYTKKQWMKEPRELPTSIIHRLPIRLTYDENYFTTKYQGMPDEGYTQLVKNMLDGIDVELGIDFANIKDCWQNYAETLVYTGPIDKFFDCEFGELDYNTLLFEHKVFKGDYQGNAVLNYPGMEVPYLRSVEHKHFQSDYKKLKHCNTTLINEDPTVVSYDHPIAFKDHPEPYYPIRDERNSALYNRYFELKKSLPNVIFGGRLGEYKYLDLDAAMSSAIQKCKKLIGEK